MYAEKEIAPDTKSNESNQTQSCFQDNRDCPTQLKDRRTSTDSVVQRQGSETTEDNAIHAEHIVAALNFLSDGTKIELKHHPEYASDAAEFEKVLTEVREVMTGSDEVLKTTMMDALISEFDSNKSEITSKVKSGKEKHSDGDPVQGCWFAKFREEHPIIFWLSVLVLIVFILLLVLKKAREKSSQDKVLDAVKGLDGTLDWVKGDTGAIVNDKATASTFTNWLLGKSDGPGTSMNCWEMVLYGAYQSGVVTKQKLAGFYGRARLNNPGLKEDATADDLRTTRGDNIKNTGTAMTLEAILNPSGESGRKAQYDRSVGWINTRGTPDSGDLVYFGPGHHVAIATGASRATRSDDYDADDVTPNTRFRNPPLRDYRVYSLLEGRNSGHVEHTSILSLYNAHKATYNPIWAFKPKW